MEPYPHNIQAPLVDTTLEHPIMTTIFPVEGLYRNVVTGQLEVLDDKLALSPA